MALPGSAVAESTFERYVDRLDAFRFVDSGALTRADLVDRIRRIDSAVAAIEGRGFEPTPFEPHPKLATAVGLGDGTALWVKDETGNVSGSHKARHLFTVALAEAIEPSGGDPFAIASCGNAALGAAVVAAAVGRRLDVYVPVWANEAVLDRIKALGARVVRTPREPGVLGDPAHHAMAAAIASGAAAFSCQGTETPAAIDGGRPIAYEMADRVLAENGPPARIDRLFVQVGGGALGTGVVTGFARIAQHATMPVLHVVQPVGNHPLVVAWDTLAAELLDTELPGAGWSAGNAGNPARAAAAAQLGAVGEGPRRGIIGRLRDAPQRYMRPWPETPESYATGILDDVTYDWVRLIEAMLSTAGYPVVCPEDDLRRAHRLARRHTDIDVCPTGSAGLGGLMTLVRDVPGAVDVGERVAVLFTGRRRDGDPDPCDD